MKAKVFLVRFNANGKCYARVAHYHPEDSNNEEITDSLLPFIADVRAQDSREAWVYESPSVLSTRWLIWSAMMERLNALRVRNTIIVGDDVYDETADYIFDVYCDRIGPLLGYPDVRCKRKSSDRDYVGVNINLFSRYVELYHESNTEPMLELEVTQ